jgi:outer membrane protein TolC
VAEALRNNLGIAQERLATERAAAGVREARGRFLPSLSLDSRYSEQRNTLNFGNVVNPAYAALNQVIGENRFPTDLDLTLPLAHESRLRLVQPLFNMSIAAGYSASRHSRDAQEFQQRSFARRLAADAQTSYLNVATARSARKTWEATLALVIESERVANRLVEAGRATPDAVFRARADRSDVEQRLVEARDDEDAAARAFNQLLRRPLEMPVEELPDSLFRFEIGLTEDEAVTRALEKREELAQITAGIRAADAGVRAATASFVPNVAIALDYGVQGQELRFSRDNDFAVASVVLSWNLFSGGQDLARRQGAQSDAERLRLRRVELEDLVRLDVTRAYRAAVVARDAIATAEAGLAAARRSFELVRRRYEEGLASQVEFLDARTSFTNAELNRVITVYRYAIRYVDLERAAALRNLDP